MRAEAALAALLLIGAAPLPTLTIDIRNVRNARGLVHADLCPERRFLQGGCPYSTTGPARTGVTTLTLRGVPAGRYAVQAFHDENGDGEVDRALFGIPREGVGFSRDARIRFAPPRWQDAEFVVGDRDERIGLSLRYFLGPSGPAAR